MGRRTRTHVNPFHVLKKPCDLSLIPHGNLQLDVDLGCGKGVFLRHYATLNPIRHDRYEW